MLKDARHFLSVLRSPGSRLPWQVLRHLARYTYWQLVYTRRRAPGKPAFLGDLLRYEPLPPVADPGQPALARSAGVNLHCADGVVRIEFVSDGIARVRLSHTGRFPALSSYAVAGLEPRAGPQEDEGAAERERDLPLPMSYGPGPVASTLRLEGRGIIVEVDPHPCRLTFRDGAGRALCADAGGAGWLGFGVACALRLEAGEALYGLGEKAFGLNRRGLRLTLWNRDPAGHDPGVDPIYQSTPFLISQRAGAAAGIFFDNTYRAEFDLGQAERDTMFYTAAGGELCYYVLAGPGLADVVARFTALTGRMPLPPLWSLGYQQSRWSYATEAEVQRVADELRRRRIPCDALYLDIHHMDGYRVFTFDRARFPDPARLIAGLRAAGFRTVTIVDPGVKVDPSYAVCADGLAQGAFCKLPNGRPYVGPVWPGDCYFPDFPNAAVRAWWGDQYRPLLDLGIAGFWNDMNEPAVFFNRTFPGAVQHRADNGQADHRALHNVYGQCMLRAAGDAMARFRPDERVLLISRAAYAGIQRYGATWTGDNRSTWEQLRVSIPIVLDMGLSGQAFTGPDVAGFSGDASGELLARWMALGAFLPYFRNHSALASAPQEPWAFGEPYESICRRFIELRYRLLPYLYTAFWQAARTGLPVVRPLALPFPGDPRVASLDDQFMCGDALMVAPVLEQGAAGRGVYLPAGGWYDFWTGKRFAGPADISVRAPLDALPLFVRAGSAIPMGPVMQHAEEFVPDALQLHLFAGEDGDAADDAPAVVGGLYEDDGHSLAYRRGDFRVTRFALRTAGAVLRLMRSAEGAYDPGYRGYDVLLRGLPGGAPEAAGELRRAGLRVRIDGEASDDWQIDAEWGAPRVQAGMFGRLEIASPTARW